jgi:uncharacterized membrane protein
VRSQRFYSYTALSIILAALTAALIHNLSGYLGLVAGTTALGSLGFYELAERKASRTGKDRKMKITDSFTKPFYELLILIPMLVTLISLDLSNSSFQYLGFSVLSVVIFSQLVEEKTINRLRKTIRPQLGQKIRIGAIVLTLFLSVMNQFYIFYGLWIIGLTAVYDIFDIIYRSNRD